MEDDIRSFDNFLTTSKGGLEDLLVSKEDNDYFNKRLSEELTDFERTVYDLRINNFGYEEIADTLGKTPKAIERTLVRIRSKLTNILKEINWLLWLFVLIFRQLALKKVFLFWIIGDIIWQSKRKIKKV
mgnify:FL=1